MYRVLKLANVTKQLTFGLTEVAFFIDVRPVAALEFLSDVGINGLLDRILCQRSMIFCQGAFNRELRKQDRLRLKNAIESLFRLFFIQISEFEV